MAKYEEHVAALRRALGPPNLPAYCKPVSKLERLGNAARASGNSDAPPCGRGSEIRRGLLATSHAQLIIPLHCPSLPSVPIMRVSGLVDGHILHVSDGLEPA